jgi:hypothetical protein
MPVALLDLFAVKGLARLGNAPPLAGACSYYDAAETATKAGKSRLAMQAEEKLRAARLLIDQQLAGSATELLLAALLAAAADRAGLGATIDPRQAGIWLYGEALPKQIITMEESTLLMRAISLAQGDAIPEEMVRALASDAEIFLMGS